MVINFRTYEITRVACKLARTTMLNFKKKNYTKSTSNIICFHACYLPRMLPSVAQVNGHELRCHGLHGYSHEMFIVAFLKTMRSHHVPCLASLVVLDGMNSFFHEEKEWCSSSFFLFTFSRGPFCCNF